MKQDTSTRAALFDFDGTLGFSLREWTRAYQLALEAEGVTLDPAEVREACFSRTQTDVVRELAISCHKTFAERIWANVSDLMHEVESYPGVADTIVRLRAAGVKVAIVTNSRRPLVAPVIDRWGMTHLFDAFVTINDVEKGKPDPEPILRALELLEASPNNAFMIGDAQVDILAGRRAAVKTIAFSPPENRPYYPLEWLRTFEPDHVAHTYEEIERLINPTTS